MSSSRRGARARASADRCLQARRRAAVLGLAVAHSLSPALHTAAYARSAWTTGRYERPRGRASSSCPASWPGADESWRGLSLTMPLKEAALACAARFDAGARQVGAVNTWSVGRTACGRPTTPTCTGGRARCGSGCGRRRAASGTCSCSAGATARSARASLAELGVRGHLRRARPARPKPWRRRGIEAMGVRSAGSARCGWRCRGVAGRVDAAGRAPAPAGRSVTTRDLAGRVLLDVVYAGGPRRWRSGVRGCGWTGRVGLEMLLHQAARQVELMTGHAAPVAAMRAAGSPRWGPVSADRPGRRRTAVAGAGAGAGRACVGLLVAAQLADGRYRHLDERGPALPRAPGGIARRPRWPGAR